MLEKNLSTAVWAVVILLVIFGCKGFQQRSSDPSQPSQPPVPQNTVAQRPDQARRDEAPAAPGGNPFPNDQPQQPVNNPDAGGDNGDPSVLYGSWASDQMLNGMQCHAEYIFENTGAYSSLAYCGSYMTRSVGTWRLMQPGLVRIEYTDHEPKVFGGQPVSYPTGESFTFTVINRNQLNTSGGVITRE